MDIIQERLEREFDLRCDDGPERRFRVVRTNGEEFVIENASKKPPSTEIDRIEEPYIEADILCQRNTRAP
jgi:GTP-binding protein LepA